LWQGDFDYIWLLVELALFGIIHLIPKKEKSLAPSRLSFYSSGEEPEILTLDNLVSCPRNDFHYPE